MYKIQLDLFFSFVDFPGLSTLGKKIVRPEEGKSELMMLWGFHAIPLHSIERAQYCTVLVTAIADVAVACVTTVAVVGQYSTYSLYSILSLHNGDRVSATVTVPLRTVRT
jgi:hypothetical protein